MTYVVLVILIALWAMVLLPPYLKDRRSSGRTFRPLQSGGSAASSAQRFLPLQNVTGGYSTSAVSSPTGMSTSGVAPLGSSVPLGTLATTKPLSPNTLAPNGRSSNTLSSNNVVHLRPVDASGPQDSARAPLATSAAAYLGEAPSAEEAMLHQAWDTPASAGVGMPSSTAAARERRRQVLLGLTGIALATLLLALFAGGNWIAAHVLVDVVMVGYVILLVRHRQLAADRRLKVEPIRPPVNEQAQAPAPVQLAPSYLRSNTGS